MAVTLRKLSQDETSRAFPRRGQMDLSEYVDALRCLQIGESAELDLDGLSSRAAKRRLGQAATQAGYRLKWARASSSDRLYFQVLPAVGSAGTRATNGRRRRGQARGATASGAASAEMSSAAAPAPPQRRRRPAKSGD